MAANLVATTRCPPIVPRVYTFDSPVEQSNVNRARTAVLAVALVAMEDVLVFDHGVDSLLLDEQRRHDRHRRLLGGRAARHLAHHRRVI